MLPTRPLRQVHDLSEHAIRADRLLGGQVPADQPAQFLIGMAEAPEDAGAGRT
jgi:hypothetical protein